MGRQLWWLLLLRGIFAVLFGIVAIVWPSITTWALVVIFGIYAIIDGLVALGRAWQTRGRFADWGWWALIGIVSIGAGIVALVWPEITALALLFVIAFYAILFGVLEVIGAFIARKIPAPRGAGAWLRASSRSSSASCCSTPPAPGFSRSSGCSAGTRSSSGCC